MKIDSFTPESGTNNGPVTVTITGTGFKSESISNIWLNCSGLERIFSQTNTITSDTQISAKFPLSGQLPGSYVIVIGTVSSAKYQSTSHFWVYYPHPPSVTEITPASGLIHDQPFTCIVKGSQFILGSDVELVNSSGIIFPATTSYIDVDRLSCSFSVGMKKGDRYVVRVINPDTQISSENVIFTVIDLPPVVTMIAPENGMKGDSSFELSVTGSGFQDGCVVNLRDLISGVSTRNIGDAIVSADGVGISCIFDLSSLHPGEYEIGIRNPDHQESKEQVFFSISPEPVSQYPITIVSGPGGVTDPMGIVSVVESSHLVISVYPEPGYVVHHMYLDGILQEPLNSLILKDIHASHEVFVDFLKTEPVPVPTQSPIPTPSVNFSIRASSDFGSEIYPVGSISVHEGSDIAFRIEAKEGFHISDTLIDNISNGDMNSWNFENVRSNHTIHILSERNYSPSLAYFEPVNPSGMAPLIVRFNSQDFDDDLYEFWDFGDGSTTYGKEFSHQYTHPGNYTVSHQVVFSKFSSWCKQEGIIQVL